MREDIPERSPQNYAVEDERRRRRAEKWIKNRLRRCWEHARRDLDCVRAMSANDDHHARAVEVAAAAHERAADLYAEVYLMFAADDGDVIGPGSEER